MPSYIRIPIVRDQQGGEAFYVGAINASLLTRIAVFTDPDLPPEERAQRAVDFTHAKNIAKYITDNPTTYTFASIEITILGNCQFTPVGEEFGYLEFIEGTELLINDGQHRTKAYEMAIAQSSKIGKDGVKVAFNLDRNLDRSRQRFSDLNGHGKAVSKSLNLLYDQRDTEAEITRRVIAGVPLFRALTEREQNSLSKASRKLFTLNGIHEATSELLCGQEDQSIEQQAEIAIRFWNAVAASIPDWSAVYEKTAISAEVRQTSLHAQAVMLVALGSLGRFLIQRHPKAWQSKLETLKRVDWSRSAPVWRGRVIVDGKLSKNKRAEAAALRHIKTSMGLPLSTEEAAAEAALEDLLATA